MTPTELAAAIHAKARHCSTAAQMGDHSDHFVIGWLLQSLEDAYTALQASPCPIASAHVAEVERFSSSPLKATN
jgi:hypothetical protein